MQKDFFKNGQRDFLKSIQRIFRVLHRFSIAPQKSNTTYAAYKKNRGKKRMLFAPATIEDSLLVFNLLL